MEVLLLPLSPSISSHFVSVHLERRRGNHPNAILQLLPSHICLLFVIGCLCESSRGNSLSLSMFPIDSLYRVCSIDVFLSHTGINSGISPFYLYKMMMMMSSRCVCVCVCVLEDPGGSEWGVEGRDGNIRRRE